MIRSLLRLTFFPALLAVSMLAIAEEEVTDVEDVPTASAEKAPLLDLSAFEDVGTLSDEELNTQRAREKIQVEQITVNDQDQDGDVTDNVAMGNTNGDNLINGEAFSNSSGFLSTVQNTGNNVLIQNSTIINVSVETPAN